MKLQGGNLGEFFGIVESVNGKVNGFVWGLPMLILLVGTGILMTTLTKVFQVTHIGHWVKNTIGGIFQTSMYTAHTGKEDTQITQFQSLCTALAATIGTGNIAGVSAAIVSGGPGAIFWMWIVAFFGMMTNFSENVLGIYYRRRNEKNEWSGGAMYYLRDGLGSKKGCKQLGAILAVLFSIFCILASFRYRKHEPDQFDRFQHEFRFRSSRFVTGIVLWSLAGLVIVGGLKRIASVTERLVPFMAIALYRCAHCFHLPIDHVGACFRAIFKGAFGMKL